MWKDGHLLTGLTWQSAPAWPSQCWSSSSLRWMFSWNKSPPGKDRLWATPVKYRSPKTADHWISPAFPTRIPLRSHRVYLLGLESSMMPMILSDSSGSMEPVPIYSTKGALALFQTPIKNYLYFTGNLRSTFSLAIWAELKAKTCPQLCQSLGVLWGLGVPYTASSLSTLWTDSEQYTNRILLALMNISHNHYLDILLTVTLWESLE